MKPRHVNGIPCFSPQSRYQDKRETSIAELGRNRKHIILIGNLRLVTVAAGVVAAVAAYRAGMDSVAAVNIAGGILLFVILAIRHNRLLEKSEEQKALIEINRMGCERWTDGWRDFRKSGDAFDDDDHPYSSDLDIFGTGSLFQYCCCAHTYYGKLRLAELLKCKDGDRNTIMERQHAVENLSELFTWRQHFESAAFSEKVARDPHDLIAWVECGPRSSGRNNLWCLLGMLPMVTAFFAVAGYLLTKSVLPAVPLLTVQLLIVMLTTRHHFRLFATFDTYNTALKPFANCIRHIEQQSFVASYLQKLSSEIATDNSAERASAALRKLGGIIDASEVRRSPLPWLLANVGLLWDLRCRVKLDQWKLRYGPKVRSWLTSIGEFEALASLALLRYDHPEWVFPHFCEKRTMGITSTGIGHPLLQQEQRIVNDVILGPPGGSIAVITGSNMSGKSTFLRTLGTNLVLAYAGAPVCATSFTAPVLAVYTSMRSGDNLLSNTSTFYAELRRIRKIVDATKRGQPLLFLIDELFSGTNSADRHDGAVALLQELSQPYTLGCISTHDLALCSLADTNDRYRNYHFREHYDGDDLHFDYTLREGPSTTRNALFLMKMAGINVTMSNDTNKNVS